MIVVITLLTALVLLNAVMLVLTVIHVVGKNERHTVSTDAGLLDAMAVQYDVTKWFELRKLRLQSELREVEAAEERSKKVVSILGETRQGPHAYDPDRPAGRRPRGMDR